MKLPYIEETSQSRIVTETFYGYNNHLKIAINEFADMENLSCRDYPMIGTRPKRGTAAALTAPQGMTSKDALLYVDAGKVFYNGAEVTGLTLTPTGEKQIVSMGAYAVFFPDKKYLNTADLSDFGGLDAAWTAEADTKIKYQLCKADGTEQTPKFVQVSEPESAANGDLWIDTSETPHTLKQFAGDSRSWLSVVTVYVKISATGIGAKFKEGDGVEIAGASYPQQGPLKDQIEDLCGTKLLKGCGADYLIVIGLLDQVYEQTGGVSVKREAPDMDYVCECGNRLWGCRYGLVDGKVVNELYASKLGDFKNWRCYNGNSTASWAASCGTDGQFTGTVNYLGNPIFFKETCLHKISISAYGAHQVQSIDGNGVQKGSWRSLAIAGETLYYKGRTGVYAYDGSLPRSVSDKLGDVRYSGAVGGSFGGLYYVAMQSSGGWSLFSYDPSRGIWCREDALHPVCFAAHGDDLYYLDADKKVLGTILGTEGTPEGDLHWMAESGVQHYEQPNHKYVTRYQFRLRLPPGSTLRLYLQYDSDGEWHYGGEVTGSGIGSFVLPVKPRRCDHLRFRLAGVGSFKLFSIARVLEQGSDR